MEKLDTKRANRRINQSKPKNSRISLLLTESLKKNIEDSAWKARKSVNEFVFQILKEHIQSEKENENELRNN